MLPIHEHIALSMAFKTVRYFPRYYEAHPENINAKWACVAVFIRPPPHLLQAPLYLRSVFFSSAHALCSCSRSSLEMSDTAVWRGFQSAAEQSPPMAAPDYTPSFPTEAHTVPCAFTSPGFLSVSSAALFSRPV